MFFRQTSPIRQGPTSGHWAHCKDDVISRRSAQARMHFSGRWLKSFPGHRLCVPWPRCARRFAAQCYSMAIDRGLGGRRCTESLCLDFLCDRRLHRRPTWPERRLAAARTPSPSPTLTWRAGAQVPPVVIDLVCDVYAPMPTAECVEKVHPSAGGPEILGSPGPRWSWTCRSSTREMRRHQPGHGRRRRGTRSARQEEEEMPCPRRSRGRSPFRGDSEKRSPHGIIRSGQDHGAIRRIDLVAPKVKFAEATARC